MKLIAGSSNIELAKSISDFLDVPLANAEFKAFSDEETVVEIKDNMRGEDVFIIQSTSRPANKTLMELLICTDAIRRSSAKRITAVMPYFGYARQDSKSGSRTPITAKLIANVLQASGVDRILTIDLHARQIQGFFDIPCDNLFAAPLIAKDVAERFKGHELTVVSPDVGGVIRARAMAQKINADLAIIDKRREKANVSEVMNVIGDVNEKHCIIVDDMVDTAGTLCNAADALKENGAKSVHAYATHGVLSGPAGDRLSKSKSLSSVTITDSIEYPYGNAKAIDKVRKITIAPLFARAIKRINEETSISELFD